MFVDFDKRWHEPGPWEPNRRRLTKAQEPLIARIIGINILLLFAMLRH